MANREETSLLLKKIEEGTQGIYSRYQKLVSAANAEYDSDIASLDAGFAKEANKAAAQSRINLSNTLETLGEKGLSRSGESVQSEITSRAGLVSALGALSAQKEASRSELERAKTKNKATLLSEAEDKALTLRIDGYKAYLEALDRDREFEADEEQRKFENSIKSAQLELEKQKAASASASASTKNSSKSTSSEDGAVSFKMTPAQYFEEIVARFTTKEKGKKYKVINKTKIRDTIAEVIRDTNLSGSWRYELMTYARSLGYLW